MFTPKSTFAPLVLQTLHPEMQSSRSRSTGWMLLNTKAAIIHPSNIKIIIFLQVSRQWQQQDQHLFQIRHQIICMRKEMLSSLRYGGPFDLTELDGVYRVNLRKANEEK